MGKKIAPLAAVMLAGCQSAMSVEEAKKVTVAFSGGRQRVALLAIGS